MGIMDQVIDTGRIEGGRAPLNTMDEVALRQKQLRKVGAILSSDAGDERHLSSRVSHIEYPLSRPPLDGRSISAKARSRTPDRMALASGQHVVARFLLLEHEPHSFDIIARMAPVALRIQIAEIEPLLQPVLDRRDRPRDLASDEGLASIALMIEQNTVGGVDAISLPIVYGNPVGINLSRRMGERG